MSKERLNETIALLITDEELNVTLTVAKNAKQTFKLSDKSLIEGIWKKYIWDSIGSYSTTDIELHVEILVANNKESTSHRAILAGNEIINHFWEHIRYADGIRINITQNGKQMSWIIVRP